MAICTENAFARSRGENRNNGGNVFERRRALDSKRAELDDFNVLVPVDAMGAHAQDTYIDQCVVYNFCRDRKFSW
jgi:hypothetical protein